MWCCYNPYHSMCLYTMLINGSFELCSQMSITHTQSYAYLILFTCIELFNLQMSELSKSMLHGYLPKA
jgi:hypothetical protein